MPVAPSAPTAASQDRAFSVAVIVDSQSEPVRREEAQAVIGEASKFLYGLTSTHLAMTDYLEDAGGGSTNDLASRYIHARTAALPNGVVVFSRGGTSQVEMAGGYGYALPGPAGFRNVFASPVTGSGQIYVAVADLKARYAPCGYGGAETSKSATSLNGECRNKAGTACLQHNGYSICSDSVAHLYASTPTYYASSTIIHAYLHLFSPGGDVDHYNTPECKRSMGYPDQYFDLQEAQYYNDLCPYVYEEFVKAFQP